MSILSLFHAARTHNKPRGDDWIQTFTGKPYWPLAPRAEDVDLVDIAAGLARTCRYNRQCLRFYSVAEHSILGAQFVPKEQRLAFLLHDAPEAILCDVPRPLKHRLQGYREIEAMNMRVIAQRFNLKLPFAPIIKEIDERIGADEREQNMAPPRLPWKHAGDCRPLGVRLQFWSPDQAMAEFIRAFSEFGGVT